MNKTRKAKVEIRWIGQMNARGRKTKGEVNSSPSVTIDNQAYTIRELYERNAGHLRDSVYREGQEYDMDHDDYDLQQLSKSDLIDRYEALERQYYEDIEAAKGKIPEKEETPSEAVKIADKEEVDQTGQKDELSK